MEIGRSIEWGEALRLVRIIRSDAGSQFAASVEGWEYPLSRIGWMLADLIDVQGSSKAGKKWKTYPRPTKKSKDSQRWGDTGGRTRTEVVTILNGLGHSLPV